MRRLLVLTVACVWFSACKDKEPVARAKQASEKKDFWPDAPKPTSATGPRTFAYKPESFAGYTITVTGGTPKGHVIALDLNMKLEVDFRPGTSPRERDAFMTLMDLTMNVMTTRMKMHLDHDGMTFQDGASITKQMRGEPGMFDVAGMTDRPLATLQIDEANKVHWNTHEDHPFEALSGGDGTLDNALVLFPDLPTTAIAPGHRWSVTRKTSIGTTKARIDIKYDYEYVGDSTCPSGATTCSLLSFTASSRSVDAVTEEGRKIRAAYGFAGKVFFDHGRGAVDESRARANIDATIEGTNMPMGATYIITPKH